MKKPGLFVLFLIFFFSGIGFSQSQIQVGSYSACINQSVQVQVTWNNVSNTTYSISYGTINGPWTQLPGATFTIGSGTPGSPIPLWVSGVGSSNNGPVSSTVAISFTVIPPPAMNITYSGYYCHNDNVTFTAPIGGTNYNTLGPCANNLSSSSNIITVPSVNAGCSGVYTISSTINGCARVGTATISVAPNYQISTSAPVSACEGSTVQPVLTAALTSNTGFEWFLNNNSVFTGANYPLPTPITVGLGGVYTVTSSINFNNVIYCPRIATTTVTVVQTSQITAGASPNSVLCQGTTLNLTANAANNPSSFTWTGPNSFFSTLQGPSIGQLTPAHSGVYSVTAVFLGPSIACTTSAQVNVQVVGVTLPLITMPANVCQGDFVNMSVVAAGANGFTWFGPCLQNFPGAAAQINSAQPSCSGTYFVSAKFNAVNSAVSCISTNSTALNVVPVNTITVVSPVQVCTPMNAILQSNATGANQFNWVGPNGYVNSGPNVTVYYPTPINSGIYTVTAFFGGSNITCSNTNSVQLTVNPIMEFTLIPRQQVCYNTPITVIGPGGATSYTWTSSTGFTSNLKDINIPSIQPKNAGSYSLSISLGPCITSAETVIEVLDPISWTLTPVSKTICRGDTIVMEGGAKGGSQNYAYVWNPGVYLDSPNGPKKTVAPLGTVVYNLIVHDIACPNFTLAHPFEIKVNQPPVPKIQLASTWGCAPFTLMYNSKVRNESAIITYDFGGLQKMQRDSFMYTLNDPGVYNLKIYTKGKNGCSGTYEYPIPITVNPKPGTDFYLTPEIPTSSDEIVFTPTTKSDPIVRYSWMFQGGVNLRDTATIKSSTDTTAEKSPLRLYNQAGRYPAMLITENEFGCVDTVFKTFDIIDDLHVFIPNTFTPNGDGINDVFYVKGMGVKFENYSLEILDRWGNVVFSTREVDKGWDGMVRGAPARDGTYTVFLKVVGMNGEGRREYTSYLNVLK